MSLNWEGDKVKRKLDDCVRRGMNQTISDAVEFSKEERFRKGHKDSPPAPDILTTRTSTLEGSVRQVKEAEKVRGEFVAVWGSVDVDYALVHELGSMGRTGVPPRPFLRPAADATYHRLPANIRNCFEGRGSIVRGGRIIARAL